MRYCDKYSKMNFNPHPYQEKGRQLLLSTPRIGLFFDLGLGKTVTTLTAVNDLMFDTFEVARVLIVAPKRVALNVWPEEIAKWAHLAHLTYSVIHGPNKLEALKSPARIHIINYDGLKWLARNWMHAPRYDMLVLDESTFVKNQGSKRFAVCRAISDITPRTVLLTGKPAPNGLIDLWAQIFLLDQGKRLCANKTDFINFYFTAKNNGTGWVPRRGTIKEISDRIGDITLTLQAEDYLAMPKLVHNKIVCDLPHKLRKEYDTLETKFFLELEGADIMAFSAGALSMKLRQYVSGFVYDEFKTGHPVHQLRLEVVSELLESLNGAPLLICVQFIHEIEMLRSHLGADTPAIYSSSSTKEDQEMLRRWNAGELPLLIANPQSIGHGLNLQSGGHNLLWFSLTWNLDVYDQTIARLWRQGQESDRVVNHVIVMRDTIDEPIFGALQAKARTQQELLTRLKEWRTK